MSITQKTPLIGYRYDALDRLINHGQPGDSERQRFYCDGRLSTELKGSDHLTIFQHGDQLLAQLHCQDLGITSSLLATDLQQSVLNAVKTNSKQSIAYTPYGHRSSGTGLFSLLGFNGQRPDPVTGQYLLGNGYRAFNPVLMRFNSPDSLSPFGKGGVNAYVYCLSDPINRSDPMGRFSDAIYKISSFFKKPYNAYWQKMPVKNARYVTRFAEDAMTFEDTYKGKLRLTFNGHGDRGVFQLGNNKEVDAAGLYALAKIKGIKFERYANLRVVACYSGDAVGHSGEPIVSFAEQLSNITGLPVKGYRGQVRNTGRAVINERLSVGEVGTRKYYYGVLKTKDQGAFKLSETDYSYQPVIFGLNSRGAKLNDQGKLRNQIRR